MAAEHFDQHYVHFLVFELDGQLYGVDVDEMEAIVEGESSDGLWSYQGQDVPARSLAQWVGLEQPLSLPARVLLVRSGDELRGFLVDTPRDIVILPAEDIFAIPALIRRALGPSPLWGVGRRQDELLLLVDLAGGFQTRGEQRRGER